MTQQTEHSQQNPAEVHTLIAVDICLRNDSPMALESVLTRNCKIGARSPSRFTIRSSRGVLLISYTDISQYYFPVYF